MNMVIWEEHTDISAKEIRPDTNIFSFFQGEPIYKVLLNGKQVYETRDAADRDFFIAELEAQIKHRN